MKKMMFSIATAILLCNSPGVSAADLGGNCCSDIEERIAELEATTARKGNRKVSLAISGWVGSQVLWWDDGSESNAYVEGLGTTLTTNVKFTGEATIVPGYHAGYVLHLEVDEANPGANNQDATNNGSGVYAYQSYWFLRSDRYGKLSIGLQESSSDNAAILVDGSGSIVPANWGLYDNGSFFVKSHGARTGAVWGDFGHCNTSGANIGGDCVAVPGNYIVYNSPVLAGFSLGASWGEDDLWDVTLRYAFKGSDFKLAGVASYAETSSPSAFAGTNGSVGYFQLGGYVEHLPTGLFAFAAFGQEDLDDLSGLPLGVDDSPHHWHLKTGIRRQWSSLGNTVLYGQFVKRDGMDSDKFEGGTLATTIRDAEINQWGFGVVQEIDAAAMSIFLAYKHFTLDGIQTNIASQQTFSDFDDFDVVKAGATIGF